MKRIFPLLIALVFLSPLFYPAKSLPQKPGDREPVFTDGGLQGFREWVQQRLMWPAHLADIARNRGLTVEFSIGADGRVTQVEVSNAPHDALAGEITKIMLESPKWVPAMRDGEAAPFSLSMPLYGRDKLPGLENPAYDTAQVVLQPVPVVDTATGQLDRNFILTMLRKFQYPEQAFEEGMEGAVMVWFETYDSGWLASYTTSESSSPAFRGEVERVIGSMVVADSVGGIRSQGPSRLLNVEFSIRYNRDSTGLHPLRQVKLSEVPLTNVQQ